MPSLKSSTGSFQDVPSYLAKTSGKNRSVKLSRCSRPSRGVAETFTNRNGSWPLVGSLASSVWLPPGHDSSCNFHHVHWQTRGENKTVKKKLIIHQGDTNLVNLYRLEGNSWDIHGNLTHGTLLGLLQRHLWHPGSRFKSL